MSRRFCCVSLAGEFFERRKREFDALQALRTLPIATTKPIAFGWCDHGRCCYTLMTWLDGSDAAAVLSTLNLEEQYLLGREAGRTMSRIHAIPAPEDQPNWTQFYNDKIDRKLTAYVRCGIHVEGAEQIIAFIEEQRGLLKDRPQSLQHGDYHCGNMVITKEKMIGIIDFDRMDYGDPWEEFNRISWCAGVSPAFASGRINGYFDNQISETFFPLMALYMATNMISSIPWAIDYGAGEVDVMKREIKKAMDAYDHFQNVVPKWYRR
ncbi:aminoglycoside phosphotransferase family protein [Sporolactobacillus terrae]|uniref:aminoglycoside phosphotransferase family protein n=1 Tax=Sporolactobacillus terrae TaxID=269673 RepID=UPI001CBCB39E|nr:phosphotransferase [Sporolactobacillus terrae]